MRGGNALGYSVCKPFEPKKQGHGGVVVDFGDEPESVEVDLEGVSGEVTIAASHQPDHYTVLPARSSIPPHQLAVIVKSMITRSNSTGLACGGP